MSYGKLLLEPGLGGHSLGRPLLKRAAYAPALPSAQLAGACTTTALSQGCSPPALQPQPGRCEGSSTGSREQPRKGNEATPDKWEPEARAAVKSAQRTLLQSTCLLRKCTGRKPCVWKLQKKPIFAINILCLTWMCALFLPDVEKGIQTCAAALKAGQQCLADRRPKMPPAPGNPTFPAAAGSCASSSGPRPAAGH